jgi:hypothetical protein
MDDAADLQLRMLGEVAVSTAQSELDAEQVADWLDRIFGP